MHGLMSTAVRARHLPSVVLPAIAVIFSVFLPACGGSRGSFERGIFREGPVAFQIGPVPEGWRKVEVTKASLAFRDDAHEGTVLVNAHCSSSDSNTPLSALTNQLLIGSTEREFVSQETEPFDQREVMHSKLRAKWDGVPTSHDVFVLKKDGCVYDFVFMSPPASFDAGVPSFESFVKSFRTLPGSGVVG